MGAADGAGRQTVTIQIDVFEVKQSNWTSVTTYYDSIGKWRIHHPNRPILTCIDKLSTAIHVCFSRPQPLNHSNASRHNRLSVEKNVSNVCSISYFHIRALRHICTCLYLESTKYIACAIVSSRLVCANSCLSGISAYSIHRLQGVQNCLTCVVQPSHSAIPSHSTLLVFLHWLPISQRLTFMLACLVYLNLHDISPAYLSSLLHAYAPIRSLRSSIRSSSCWTSSQSYTCFSELRPSWDSL